jgi:hypothetical protein
MRWVDFYRVLYTPFQWRSLTAKDKVKILQELYSE